LDAPTEISDPGREREREGSREVRRANTRGSYEVN
jgi:hypothetical protein